jgi:hypothetical protein
MKRRALTPKVRAALRQLAAGPQDMRDEALLERKRPTGVLVDGS